MRHLYASPVNRVNRLRLTGNGIVPAAAYPLAAALYDFLCDRAASTTRAGW